jgi:hypothetical protein
MLQLRNRTRFTGTIFGAPDPEGIDTLYTIVKGTFDLGHGGVPAEEQLPIAMKDEHFADPAASSIKVPADIGLVKPGTDVLLIGHAYAPGGWPAYYVDVSLQVGPLFKLVRVFGDRLWEASAAGTAATAPQPFEVMPLLWERAYGGAGQGATGPVSDVRNPVGRGFHAPDSPYPVDGMPLPNLEDPAQPIGSWKHAPQPACFAPISPHWEPRRSFAGSYDEAWQQQRSPYLPRDFDARFFHLAPPGLTHSPGYLQGNEHVDIRGATPAGELRFQLPAVHLNVTYTVAGKAQEEPANLDTIIIEPDAARFVLVWRAALRCDKKLLRVDDVAVDEVA